VTCSNEEVLKLVEDSAMTGSQIVDIVDILYAAPQAHGIVNVALHRVLNIGSNSNEYY
jgi:hypothetical protein